MYGAWAIVSLALLQENLVDILLLELRWTWECTYFLHTLRYNFVQSAKDGSQALENFTVLLLLMLAPKRAA